MNETHRFLADRRTAKVMANDSPLPCRQAISSEKLDYWVAVAGNAPFHKPAHKTHMKLAEALEPWRCIKFTDQDCRDLALYFQKSNIDTGKINSMLNAADAMVLVNWLPNPPLQPLQENTEFEATHDNMEIIAATGAFCQALLTAGEAEGWRTYWSSGGYLRQNSFFEQFDIPLNEILLGAIFFFPSNIDPENTITRPGNLASKRSNYNIWSRWFDMTKRM